MDDQAFDLPFVLLVEGVSDRGVFETLLARAGNSSVRVIEYGGKTRLAARLEAIALNEAFQERCRWLGIVRDADGNEARTVQSIRTALTNAGLPSPAAGELIAPGPLAVQIIVLPGDGGSGELEDVIWRAIAAESPEVAKCVDGFLACARPDGLPTADLAKARVYSVVAALSRPDRPLGASARATDGPFPMHSPILAGLLDFIPLDDKAL